MSDYGVDHSPVRADGTIGTDWTRAPVRGPIVVAFRVFRRWLQHRGTLLYARDVGAGVGRLQNADADDVELARWASGLVQEARREPGCVDCSVRIERVREVGGDALTITAVVSTKEGAYPLQVSVDELVTALFGDGGA
jgi:hypothetical protein